MFALIESVSGEDFVTIATSREKLEKAAITHIQEHLDCFLNTDFVKMEEFPLLKEVMNTNDAQTAMDLFVDMTDKFSDSPIFIRIVGVELITDA